jgi:hypothetical protein
MHTNPIAGALLFTCLITACSPLIAACSPDTERFGAQDPPSPAGPVALTGNSRTHDVRGEYRSIALERIDGLALENGTVMIRGLPGTVPLDMPDVADTSRPNRRWVLVSEADIDGRLVVSFIHQESVEDFRLELPGGGTELRYGAFSGRSGGDVLVFAWGDHSRAYSGYVTIARR